MASVYERHISLPWQNSLVGAQRVVMVVYDKDLEKAFRARKGEFEQRTIKAGHRWAEFDCTQRFAHWLAGEEYREAFFEYPTDLRMKVTGEFLGYVANPLRELLQKSDAGTVVALTGVASLYGFLRVSELVHTVEPDIKGRLAVFFPGVKESSNYRLLDARDGWNYLAYSITLNAYGGAV